MREIRANHSRRFRRRRRRMRWRRHGQVAVIEYDVKSLQRFKLNQYVERSALIHDEEKQSPVGWNASA